MAKMYPTKKYPGIYQEKEQLEEIEELPEITEEQVQLRKKIRDIYEKIRGSKDYIRKMAAIIRRLGNKVIPGKESVRKFGRETKEVLRGFGRGAKESFEQIGEALSVPRTKKEFLRKSGIEYSLPVKILLAYLQRRAKEKPKE